MSLVLFAILSFVTYPVAIGMFMWLFGDNPMELLTTFRFTWIGTLTLVSAVSFVFFSLVQEKQPRNYVWQMIGGWSYMLFTSFTVLVGLVGVSIGLIANWLPAFFLFLSLIGFMLALGIHVSEKGKKYVPYIQIGITVLMAATFWNSY